MISSTLNIIQKTEGCLLYLNLQSSSITSFKFTPEILLKIQFWFSEILGNGKMSVLFHCEPQYGIKWDQHRGLFSASHITWETSCKHIHFHLFCISMRLVLESLTLKSQRKYPVSSNFIFTLFVAIMICWCA